MASIFGKNLKISIFGQSHSDGIGVVIDGLPAGRKIDFESLQFFLSRRSPGRNDFSSQRSEPDEPEFLSGLIDDMTCGAPICAIIRNTDVRPEDYYEISEIPRPGHADFTARVKFGGYNDLRGGGHLSGRLTAPLCVAGGICLQLLEQAGIEIGAHIADIAGIADELFDPVKVSSEELCAVKRAEFPTISAECGEVMLEAVWSAKNDGDSLGGVIECAAIGIPAGFGDPIFDGVENRISSVVFAIPAVCGIEFGNGFVSALLRGSANNDAMYMDGGDVKALSNNHGGVLGGITSGMPLIFRVAIKPTPSIAIEQDSVRFSTPFGLSGENTKLSITGRHDPCIVPRAVPCVEAAAAIAVLDMILPGT
ncbi:MAG: chorismate synthase [Oscillospiraceae bacterium]|nr:chorismate synthase [Oscillospiraceae bacterium]